MVTLMAAIRYFQMNQKLWHDNANVLLLSDLFSKVVIAFRRNNKNNIRAYVFFVVVVVIAFFLLF